MAKNIIVKILTGSCPRCGEEKMWEHGAYNISKMMKMRKRCPNCKANLEPEPSFYTGALYVSYAFSVAIVMAVFWGAHILFNDPSINAMFFGVLVAIIVFAPLSIRLSRNIWAALFIK